MFNGVSGLRQDVEIEAAAAAAAPAPDLSEWDAEGHDFLVRARKSPPLRTRRSVLLSLHKTQKDSVPPRQKDYGVPFKSGKQKWHVVNFLHVSPVVVAYLQAGLPPLLAYANKGYPRRGLVPSACRGVARCLHGIAFISSDPLYVPSGQREAPPATAE